MKTAAALLAVLALAVSACGSGTGTVPTIAAGSSLEDAYQLLRGDGFRVAVDFSAGKSIPDAFLQAPLAQGVTPAPGTNVGPGGDVTIIAAPGPHIPPTGGISYPHVPNFVRKPAEAAVTWADGHSLLWAIPKLPRLPASNAALLLDAYTIVAQKPNPGAVLHVNQPLTLTVRPG